MDQRLEQFKTLMGQRKFKEAGALLQPGTKDPLLNLTTDEGYEAFNAVLATNSYKVVKAYLSAARGERSSIAQAAHNCAVNGWPESLRMLVEGAPDLVTGIIMPYDTLYDAFKAAGQDNVPQKKRGEIQQCMQALIDVGIIEHIDDDKTHLDWALGETDDVYCQYIINQGADLQALERMPPGYLEWRASLGGGYGARYSKLKHGIAARQEEMKAEMQPSPGEVLKQYDINVGMRGLVHQMLSAGHGAVFTTPEIWEKRGGMEAALKFIDDLSARLPARLAYMHERFDLTALQREAELPREGSVTAGYVRGAAHGQERT